MVNLATPSAFADYSIELGIARSADAHDCSIVEQHLQLAHIIGSPRAATVKFGHHRMHTARVIAEHPANRAAIVRRRIGTKKKPVLFRFLEQVIEHETGLDA